MSHRESNYTIACVLNFIWASCSFRKIFNISWFINDRI